MKVVQYMSALVVPLVLLVSPVHAQQDEEVTIDVVPAGEAAPEDVTSEIKLPEPAPDRARENAGDGLDAASSAREKRREFGREKASEAREGREGRGPSDTPAERPGRGGDAGPGRRP